MEERAVREDVCLDWNRWHTFNKRDRHGDMVIIQWARVLKR